MKQLALWAGFECTRNRVADRYFDQLELTGHAYRIQDLDLLADHGVKTVRYPVLWEQVCRSEQEFSWEWADARLTRLRELGIEPIVGLLHHGSGPNFTSLLDPLFAEKFARFAGAVAARYPWVRQYTPINEPLTTARFSCLYGHWYPHERSDRAFVQAVLNQMRATKEAMSEIRQHQPGAKLVQTEDLGEVASTESVAYQARFENARRWLSWDLLVGKVGRAHPLRKYLVSNGATESELEALVERPCPPDVVGVNHYVTSNRFLDSRLHLYQSHLHGGNGRNLYVDVEAVRVQECSGRSLSDLLLSAWRRYQIPIAVTEAHLGCTREEQMRWLAQVWSEAEKSVGAGADVRAVTAWAFLGSYNWNSLVTRDEGYYEPGLYDVRHGQVRPTALSGLVRALAAGEVTRHPSAQGPGWWQRPIRFQELLSADSSQPPEGSDSVLVITGGSGALGRAFAQICQRRGIATRVLGRNEMDIADPEVVSDALSELKVWGIVNTAGYVRIEAAERDRDTCFRENHRGATVLAKYCAKHSIPLLTFSSNLVFDGQERVPYVESSTPSPLNVYGFSKYLAEQEVLEFHPKTMVVRTSALFGPWNTPNFLSATKASLQQGRHLVVAEDCLFSATYIPELVDAALDLWIDGAEGLWHLANGGETTWAELARFVAHTHGFDEGLVRGRSLASLNLSAKRPSYSVLGSERAPLMRPLKDVLAQYWDGSKPRSQQAIG